MTVTMTADDGTKWTVTRGENQQVIIHDAKGEQRLAFREGMILAAVAINGLAKQDREKKGKP